MSQFDPGTKPLPPDIKFVGPTVDAQQFVVDETKKKKKKRRYTKGLRTIQNFERGVARSLDVLAEGFARVFSEYKERSEKSARKKRDGALRDGIENWTKAMGKGMSVSSKAPYDFAKTVTRGRASKQLRRTLRALTPPPLR
jgi:hypothetical protein